MGAFRDATFILIGIVGLLTVGNLLSETSLFVDRPVTKTPSPSIKSNEIQLEAWNCEAVLPLANEKSLLFGNATKLLPPVDERVTIPLPEWYEGGFAQCQVPPKDQLVPPWIDPSMQNVSRPTSEPLRKKIAFLLQEYESITFPKVWQKYFAGASADEYILYVHFAKKIIVSRTLSIEYFNALYPNETVFDSTYNVRYLQTNHISYYMHLMPNLLGFWREALQDETIAGFIPLSGNCLPMKSFSSLYRSLVTDRHAMGDHTILNIAADDRSKSSFWGFHSRYFVERVICYEELLARAKECSMPGTGGASEEECPALMIKYLGLPSQHGIITFDCWSAKKMENFSDSPKSMMLTNWGPLQFKRLDFSLLNNLIESGAFFARKFEPGCLIDDLNMMVEDYILSKVLCHLCDERKDGLVIDKDAEKHQLVKDKDERKHERVSCGNHDAKTCAECPQGHGSALCNGECKWLEKEGACIKAR